MASHFIRRHIASRLQSSEPAPSSDFEQAVPATLDEVFLNLHHIASFVKREPQPATDTSALPAKSCGPNDNTGICQKPDSVSSNTLPIVLGVVIPVIVALAILLVLHRRYLKKLRSEDANDKHKSLDFGLGDVGSPGVKKGKQGRTGKAIPEMSITDTEKSVRRERGLSLDLGSNNPYMLPPELQQSRESLHSLSRTINNGDDKYRPATTFLPGERAASRQGSMRGADDSSSYTASTRRGVVEKDNESNYSLLRHAQRMSRSNPPMQRTSVTSAGSAPVIQDPVPGKTALPVPANGSLAPMSSEQNRDSFRSDISKDGPTAGFRQSNNYLGAFIRSGGPPAAENKVREEQPTIQPSSTQEEESNMKVTEVEIVSPTPVLAEPEPLKFDFPPFEESVPIIATDAPDPDVKAPEGSGQLDHHKRNSSHYEEDFDYDDRRLTMGLRPLPPDDPTEDPEQRAIRIRSFYKEYFDDAKPGPQYDSNGPVYDEVSGHYVNRGAPFAQPMGRRAMTPPPRGPASFQAPGRIAPSQSGGHFVHGGPRAHSSASGRFGPANPGPPKKKLPPPSPLQMLPTPHKLKDDSIIPIDFAPPSSFRERRAGTPDSLKGGLRPYSPALPAPLPLASSFDDLAVMPSP